MRMLRITVFCGAVVSTLCATGCGRTAYPDEPVITPSYSYLRDAAPPPAALSAVAAVP